jgi:hypothetical protein
MSHALEGSASDESVPPSFSGGHTASATVAGYGVTDPTASGGLYAPLGYLCRE